MEILLQILDKTGIFFYPIAACSIIGAALFIEKIYILRGSKVFPDAFVSRAVELLEKGETSGAKILCEQNGSAAARVALAAIEADGGERKQTVDRSLENESLDLYSHIEMLGAISSVSTLLGLMGTISGMIKIFSAISLDIEVNPASLAGGISEALYTTALGLGVAIPTFVAHKYLAGKYEAVMLGLEQASEDILKSLRGGGGE